MSENKNAMPPITVASTAQELTPGGMIYGGGNSAEFLTGAWSSVYPVWLKEKCKQCLLCYPVCPDVSIPAKDQKRLDFDVKYCKGCGICARVCPFGAIEMKDKGGAK